MFQTWRMTNWSLTSRYRAACSIFEGCAWRMNHSCAGLSEGVFGDGKVRGRCLYLQNPRTMD